MEDMFMILFLYPVMHQSSICATSLIVKHFKNVLQNITAKSRNRLLISDGDIFTFLYHFDVHDSVSSDNSCSMLECHCNQLISIITLQTLAETYDNEYLLEI